MTPLKVVEDFSPEEALEYFLEGGWPEGCERRIYKLSLEAADSLARDIMKEENYKDLDKEDYEILINSPESGKAQELVNNIVYGQGNFSPTNEDKLRNIRCKGEIEFLKEKFEDEFIPEEGIFDFGDYSLNFVAVGTYQSEYENGMVRIDSEPLKQENLRSKFSGSDYELVDKEGDYPTVGVNFKKGKLNNTPDNGLFIFLEGFNEETKDVLERLDLIL